jgi:flagellar L-ring protein precursor FlgH
LDSRDAMKFTIACEVVDVRPNGTLVIEGRRSVRNNEEVWDAALTGVVRPEDLLPNNTVRSENIAELRVYKRELGHVRDAYRRGWFLKWLDLFQPF